MAGVKTAAGILVCALLALSCNNNLTTALEEKVALSEKQPPLPGSGGTVVAGSPRATVIPISWTRAEDGTGSSALCWTTSGPSRRPWPTARWPWTGPGTSEPAT
jgi:hypothetical protein